MHDWAYFLCVLLVLNKKGARGHEYQVIRHLVQEGQSGVFFLSIGVDT